MPNNFQPRTTRTNAKVFKSYRPIPFSRGSCASRFNKLFLNPVEILFRQEAYQIIGACLNVYKDKGHGFVEPVYQECLEIELAHQDIPYDPQMKIYLDYRGQRLRHSYIPDVTCYGKIIVELKAVKLLADEHRAQLMNYLKATGLQLGLLVNFGHYPGLQWERIVFSNSTRNDE